MLQLLGRDMVHTQSSVVKKKQYLISRVYLGRISPMTYDFHRSWLETLRNGFSVLHVLPKAGYILLHYKTV